MRLITYRVLSLLVSCSSLIHMTLLNIEPLSINTHTLSSPALQFPQPHPPHPLPSAFWANTAGQGAGREDMRNTETWRKQRVNMKVAAVREKWETVDNL